MCKGSLRSAGHGHISDISFPHHFLCQLLHFCFFYISLLVLVIKAKQGLMDFFFLPLKVHSRTDVCNHCALNSLCYIKTSQSLEIGVDLKVALSAQVLFNGSESPSLNSLSHFFPKIICSKTLLVAACCAQGPEVPSSRVLIHLSFKRLLISRG